MIKRVCVGVTTGHDYSAFIPVVGLLWRERIGFEPTFFLVGSEKEWVDHQYAHIPLNALREFDIHHVFVPHMDGVEDATISQCVRNAAAVHPFPDGDLLISSDADLLPIRKEFYHQHDPKKKAISLFYSNAYDPEPDHWASCHYSMLTSTWREVMDYKGNTIIDALAHNFAEYGLAEKMKAKADDPQKGWVAVWFTDELVASKKIKESRYFPDQVLFIPREGHPPKDRLDRASWPFYTGDVTRYTDCHSLRPMWNVNVWPRLRPVLHQLLPNHKAWLDEYRDRFWKAMGVDA